MQVSYNYVQAAYMSNLFYNAQRVGHLPADNSVSWRYNALLNEQGACYYLHPRPCICPIGEIVDCLERSCTSAC